MAIEIKGLTGNVDIAVEGGAATSFLDYGVAPASNLLTGGWASPKYYQLEVDPSTDELVIEPGKNSIAVLYKVGGKSWNDVKTEQSLSQNDLNSVGNQVRLNPSWGYGTTDALAVDQELAEELASNQYAEYFQSVWLLAARGANVASSSLTFERPGESALHPIVVGSYGTGVAPKFLGNTPRPIAGSANFVIKDVDCGHAVRIAGLKYMCASNITCDHSNAPSVGDPGLTLGGTDDDGMLHATARCMKFIDINQDVPGDSRTEWSFSADRVSPYYAAKAAYVNFDKMFDTYGGWSVTYNQGGTNAGGQTPDDRSHSKYIQRNVHLVTVSNHLTLFPNFQAGQWRSDCVAQDLFCMGANSGWAFLSPIQEARMSYADGLVQYKGGWKQYAGNSEGSGGPVVVANGMYVEMPQMPIYNILQCNSGTGTYFSTTDSTEVANGPKLVTALSQQVRGVTFDSPELAPALTGSFATSLESNYAIANWSTVTDSNVTPTEASNIAAKSLGGWLDEHLSQTAGTSDDDDAEAYLRAHAAPWTFVKSINDYFQDPLGWVSAERTTSSTCTFSAVGNDLSPPTRADVKRNWSTGDLPGTVSGDSISINDDVEWNQTPVNSIAGLTLGANGSLTMYGGALRPSSVTVATGGNLVTLDGGSKFDLPGYTGSGRLSVVADESRFVNTGTVNGNVDLTSRYKAEVVLAEEGETFTLDSSGTLTSYGPFPYYSAINMGFDGYSGGTATAVINGTLAFKTSCWLAVDGLTRGSKAVGSSGGLIYVNDYKLPKIGDVVENSDASASGVVRKILNVNPAGGSLSVLLYLTDTVGVFADNDTLTSTDLWMRDIFQEDTGGDFGAVNGTPTYRLGALGEVVTGRGPQVGDLPAGFNSEGRTTEPSVNSVLTLSSGSTVTVQTEGLSSGTYDLIDVDSLTDNGATLPSGVTVSLNKLQLTIS